MINQLCFYHSCSIILRTFPLTFYLSKLIEENKFSEKCIHQNLLQRTTIFEAQELLTKWILHRKIISNIIHLIKNNNVSGLRSVWLITTTQLFMLLTTALKIIVTVARLHNISSVSILFFTSMFKTRRIHTYCLSTVYFLDSSLWVQNKHVSIVMYS